MLKKIDLRQVQRSMREAQGAFARTRPKEGVMLLRITQPERDPGPAPGRPRVDTLPLAMFGKAEHERTRLNHGQSLVALARGGGLSAPEVVCILRGRHWRDGMPPEDEAHAILHAKLWDHLAARRATGTDTGR